MPRVFINYRRDDSAGHAGRLYDELSDHFGERNVFMDVDAIDPGADFVEVIEGAVDASDVMITLIGRRWLTDTDDRGRRRLDDRHDFVRLEIATALDRKVRIVPVLVQGARMPGSEDLPDELARLGRRNALELRDTRWRDDVARLIEALERVPGMAAPPRSQPEPDSGRPGAAPVVGPVTVERPDEEVRADGPAPRRPAESEATARAVAEDSVRASPIVGTPSRASGGPQVVQERRESRPKADGPATVSRDAASLDARPSSRRRSRTRWLAAGGLVLLLGTLAAFGFFWLREPPLPDRLRGDATAAHCGTAPSAAVVAPPVAGAPNPALQATVEGIFAELPPGTSAVFQNLAGPERAERDASTQVKAASTIKLPLMIEVFRQARAGQLRLDDKLTVKQDDVVGGTGILQQHPGVTLTALQMLQTTVAHSDNTGGNILLKRVGEGSLNRTMRQEGFGQTEVRRLFMDQEAGRRGLENQTSAADMAQMLRRVYRGELVDQAASAEMLRLLRCRGKQTDPTLDYLGRDLVPRPTIGHVNGVLPGIRNDVGVVERGGRAFVLALLLRDQADERAAEEAIARAAQRILAAVEQMS